MFPSFGGVGPYGTVGSGPYGSLVGYGSLTLTDSSPVQSFAEPLTVDQVKNYLKLPVESPVDTSQDDLISSMISAAREQAEIMQGRDLVRKQWDLTHDYWPGWRIELRPHLVSVDLVQIQDSDNTVTALAENTDYLVDKRKNPGVIAPPYGETWRQFTPWPSSAVLIRFTSGLTPTDPFWLDSGARVKIGMKMLISSWHHNRLPFDRNPGTVGQYGEYPYAVTSCLSYGSLVRPR